MLTKENKRLIKDLQPYDKNPRRNKEAVDRVLESLNRHGQVKPIVISAKGKPFEQEIICCGHTTLEALKRFGAKEAFVVVKEFADEAQFLDYNIRDNKTSEYAQWDEAILAELAGQFDIDLSEMGFDFEIENQEKKEIKDLSDIIDRSFEVSVECADETQQKKIYNELITMGLKCRILTL